MKKNGKQHKVNPEILQRLLSEPEVKKFVDLMTTGELELYKKLLVNQGIYAQYAREQKHAGV